MKKRVIPFIASLFLLALASPALACGDKASCPMDESQSLMSGKERNK